MLERRTCSFTELSEEKALTGSSTIKAEEEEVCLKATEREQGIRREPLSVTRTSASETVSPNTPDSEGTKKVEDGTV